MNIQNPKFGKKEAQNFSEPTRFTSCFVDISFRSSTKCFKTKYDNPLVNILILSPITIIIKTKTHVLSISSTCSDLVLLAELTIKDLFLSALWAINGVSQPSHPPRAAEFWSRVRVMLRPSPAVVHYFLTHFQWFWDFVNSCFLRDTFMTLVLTGGWKGFKAQLESHMVS